MKNIDEEEFLIALSYSGKTKAQVAYATSLNKALCSQFKQEEVFFDKAKIHQVRLPGKNKFAEIYTNSKLIIAVVSNSYFEDDKNTGVELLQLLHKMSNDDQYLIIGFEELKEKNKFLSTIIIKNTEKENFSNILEVINHKLRYKISNIDEFLIDPSMLYTNGINNDYQIELDRNKYEELYSEVKLLDNQKPEFYTKSKFFIKRDYLENQLNIILDDFGIALIHGPQGIGKTMLINSFLNKNDYEIIHSFKPDKYYQKLLDLYADWTKNIISELIFKFGIKKAILKSIKKYEYIVNFSEDSVTLAGALAAEYQYYCSHEEGKSSKFEAINRIIENVINDLKMIKNDEKKNDEKKKENFVVEITIDSFEKLLNKNLIKPFHEDCSNFFKNHKDTENKYKGIKFIFSSRFFQTSRPSEITLNVSKFSFDEIKKLFLPIIELENIKQPDIFYRIVYDLTNGYQWFVIRLIKIYLKIRQKPSFDKFSVLDISKNPEYWINDDLFKLRKNVKSKFIESIVGIIESNSQEDDKDKFCLIINRMMAAKKELKKIKKEEIEQNKDNLILMESGIMDYSYNVHGMKLDKIIGYGNLIIQEYIIDEISQNLDEF